MKKPKTLQNLIDEIVEEFFDKFDDIDGGSGLLTVDISNFLEHALIRVAQETMKKAEIRYKKMKTIIVPNLTLLTKKQAKEIKEAMKHSEKYGYNQAISEIETKLKQFMGRYYEDLPERQNDKNFKSSDHL